MIVIVGAGNMAREYASVLQAQAKEFVVVGRGEKSAAKFLKDTGIQAVSGGIANYLVSVGNSSLAYAIVSTGVEELANTTRLLVEGGVKNILVEKPAGLTVAEIGELVDCSIAHEANIYVAYNRRFYASVQSAKKLIAEDGGVKSFTFELTEWGHVIKDNLKPDLVKENWFLANTSHVADMAYFLGGAPKELSCFYNGGLDWHKRSHNYAGAGVSSSGALFSYHGNWAAPGRWSVEILTTNSRYIFRPMEKLQVQKLGSIVVDYVDIDDHLDHEFKPGLYKQVQAFLTHDNADLCSLEEHLTYAEVYTQMAGYK